MSETQQKYALITGASSGLGIDFARLLAERHVNLVLVARSLLPMEMLAVELSNKHGIKVHVIALDLASSGAGEALKSRLDAQSIAIDILINNAGYGLFGEFLTQPLDTCLNMLQLNMLTLTELTHVFAQDMASRGKGQILLVSSVGGYQATPLYAAYSASKSYVLLFGEALHEELKSKGITVTVLSPGITATNFLSISGQSPTLYQRLFMMQSRTVAAIGLAALHAGRASIVAGWLNAITAWSNRFAPRILQRKVAHSLMKN